MAAVAFNTLNFTRKLQDHGFAANQAEGLAEVASVVIDNANGKFALIDGKFIALEKRIDTLETKFDILEHKFDTLEHKVDARVSRSELTLIKWICSMGIALFSAIIGSAAAVYQMVA